MNVIGRTLFLDCETSGLNPSIHALTDLCGLVVEYDENFRPGIVCEFSQLIKPDLRLVYTDEALKLQGRTYDQLREEGRPIGHVFNDFRAMVVAQFGAVKKCSPVAHNAAFDKGFIDANCTRYNLQPITNYCWRCSVDLFRWMQTMGMHDCYRANLDAICEHYEIVADEETRHTASGDCMRTAIAVGRMMMDFRGIHPNQDVT